MRARRRARRSHGGIERLFDGQVREQLERGPRRSFHTEHISNVAPRRRRDGSQIKVEISRLVTQLTALMSPWGPAVLDHGLLAGSPFTHCAEPRRKNSTLSR
jgi:hypothetical protein